jgi:transcriptional regulator with GAF, ATPase, and Fis domain
VQDHEHVARQLGHRREVGVDVRRLAARERQLDAVVGEGGALGLYLPHQGQ